MNQRNYQKELEERLEELKEKKPRKKLLLHCCCAPCSSYTLEYLSSFFDIFIYFYNPNITSEEEYQKRKAEEVRFLKEYPFANSITFVEDVYEPQRFTKAVKGLEREPEGGKRCEVCYQLRLEETAKRAVEGGFDYFCTTLSISPYKNADKLMKLGEKLGEIYGVSYLPSDFKKKNGYKRSIELSHEYGLYRQDYCGCIYSKRERDRIRGLNNEDK